MKKTILINIALILSFFLLFEIYLRIFDLSSLRGLSETYSENRKNLEGRAFGEKFYTDQYGFRVPNKNFSYVEKNKNIILIGDSFVFGPGVNEEITFSGKLRKERNKFNVYNSARPGDQINDYYFQIKYFVENLIVRSRNNRIHNNQLAISEVGCEQNEKQENKLINAHLCFLTRLGAISTIHNPFMS